MSLFERKIKEFPTIIKWVEDTDVSALRRFILDNSLPNRFFLGSGGSYSAAAFAESLSIQKGFMSRAITPFMFDGGHYNKIPASTLLISASGSNNDILRSFREANNGQVQRVGALTLSPKGWLHDEMEKDKSETLFEFPIPTGRDGFLSTNTVLAFYLFLYKVFGYDDIDLLDPTISPDEDKEISDFVNSLKQIPSDGMTSQEAFLHKLEGVDSFFVLYTANSYPAAFDIESKFSEGAMGNTQLADYRNFAHGRFNWFTQRPGQTGLICLQTPEDVQMSEEILSHLPVYVPILRIKTKHRSPLGCIDLLIKEHYLCKAMAERWGLDISRPKVPDYGRYLHNL